jgi:hypothetical protein
MNTPTSISDSHAIKDGASAPSATDLAKIPKRQPTGLPESGKGHRHGRS